MSQLQKFTASNRAKDNGSGVEIPDSKSCLNFIDAKLTVLSFLMRQTNRFSSIDEMMIVIRARPFNYILQPGQISE